ncbi:MAG: hypothetical protein UT97_C0030G0001 [Parcubacteria group bacterium GW2011_GWC2_40_31]|nr:MAG: hypothetical protein UT97_C0030G0001 [Parcubacteria group bacterium GW2011_GWC2_40_31]
MEKESKISQESTEPSQPEKKEGSAMIESRANFDAFEHRPDNFHEIAREQWEDWRWQQQNAIRSYEQLEKVFLNIPEKQLLLAKEWERRGFRFQLTPYMQAIAEKDNEGNPLLTDPIWRQFFPAFDELLTEQEQQAIDEYSPERENWEIAEEMLTPIAHHKYDNRAILYTADVCLGYCNYCLRSLQSKAKEETHGGKAYWQQTMEAIYNHPEIEEVILSGGDPLIYDNATIEKMLKDIREIPSVKAIRIHTRAFTHNPYRIDKEFGKLLKKYAVTEVAIHTTHPNELTKDFQESIDRIRESKARTLLLAQIPLVKGVNDDAELLHRFFMELYASGVKPYYFLHNMPNIPAAASQRTSVKRGLELMNRLGRKISHPAMPEYIIVHRTGKRTVPIEPEGTPEFRYETDQDGHPIIRFKNWKGNWETYIDGKD